MPYLLLGCMGSCILLQRGQLKFDAAKDEITGPCAGALRFLPASEVRRKPPRPPWAEMQILITRRLFSKDSRPAPQLAGSLLVVDMVYPDLISTATCGTLPIFVVGIGVRLRTRLWKIEEKMARGSGAR